MKKFIHVLLLLSATQLAKAHFVFVVPEPGGAKARVFISEELKPTGEVDAGIIKETKLSVRSLDGKETPLTLVPSEKVFEVSLPEKGALVIHGISDLGLNQRGGKAHILLYYPKTILGGAFETKATLGEPTPVELVPTGKPGSLKLQLLAHGKPQPNAEITVILPDGTQKKVKTDESGETEAFPQYGQFGAWARFWEPSLGERDGKKYEELRHYATLVFDVDRPVSRFATLPEATSSFGAVVSGAWLYVYGGHIAPTHNYSVEAVSGRFSRLSLADHETWEQLPSGPAAQGLNLATYEGKIYRVGGMSPQNAKGKPADNHSIADCARYDPKTGKWEALPSLPEARSSHDVVVIGNQLLVMGGWTLKGKGQSWVDTLAVLDLSAPNLAWKTVPEPFHRRALIAAAYHDKLYVIGGFNDKNDIVRNVSIYDPKTSTWSEGPELPDGPGLAFAPAAAVHDSSLYVSVSDGLLLRLNEANKTWEKAGKGSPRVAHRLVSVADSVLSIGGAEKGNNLDLIEAIPVGQ